jgi:hypothetical protein
MTPSPMIECKYCRANIEDDYDHLAFEGFCSKACKTMYGEKEHKKVQDDQRPVIEKGA